MASIRLTDVSVDIPVYDVGSASIRKLLIGRAAGGRFSETRSYVVVNALKNISFEAHDGDRIGLVGTNGSGKTTLLRVLSDVYAPTSGTVATEGRVSPMFDITLGMNLDATGYENIRICGMLWGLTRRQIEARLGEIAEFTELGGFLHMPVRTYSAGMQMRLAFAIATARDPEILLLDEGIGAGDATFFEKAFARLQEIVRRSRIMVVASHADAILRQLCNKAMWLDKGALVHYGEIEETLARYHEAEEAARLRAAG